MSQGQMARNGHVRPASPFYTRVMTLGIRALALASLFLVSLQVPVAPSAHADPGQPPGLDKRAASAAKKFLERTDPQAVMSADTATGVIDSVTLEDPAPAPGAPQAVAEAFLTEHGEMFGVRSLTQLTAAGTTEDSAGGVVVAFRQQHEGLPVVGGELKVRVADHAVTSVHGVFLPDVQTSAEPTLDADRAEQIALDGVRRHSEDAATADLRVTDNTLSIFRTGLLAGVPGANRLVHGVEVADTTGNVRHLVYVDATTGVVLQAIDLVHEAMQRDVYEGSTSHRVFAEGDADPIPVTAENQAKVGMWQNLADGARETYNLFASMAGRDSYNGAGIRMRSVARASSISHLCPNATWNGFTTNFCTGMDTDDIVAHEWGHAYTGATSRLVYAWQSGALNESYSDVWGEVVDLMNDRGGDADESLRADGGCSTEAGGGSDPSLRWVLGEDAGTGAIRDMWNPICVGLPGKVTDAEYIVPADGWDAGGVHINSGVPNHAFALVTDGGTYNEVVVRGIGLTKTAHIWWNAGLKLTPTSRFPAFATALESACQELVGADLRRLSLQSPAAVPSGEVVAARDCRQVSNAVEATQLRVPVHDPTNPGPAKPYLDPTTGARCPDGETTVHHREGFEEGLGEWTAGRRGHESRNVQPDWTVTDDLPAGAPTGAKAAYGGFVTASFYNEAAFFLDSPTITMPAGVDRPLLSLDHWFHFALSFGGGVNRAGNLKISVDGGAWQLVPQSAWVRNGYNFTVPGPWPQNNYYPPLAGERAWANLDGDRSRAAWARSIADLSQLTEPGDQVRLRFDLKHDYNHFNIPAQTGWYVDDVVLYSCTDTTGPTARPWHFDRANEHGWNSEAVTIRWRWTDADLGIDPDECDLATHVAAAGVSTVSASCADLAGNVGTASYTVRVDDTPPVLHGPQLTTHRQLEGLPILARFGAVDPLSGVLSRSCEDEFALDTARAGEFTLTCSATNYAELTALASVDYEVITAAQAIGDLREQVLQAGLEKNKSKSFAAQLKEARALRESGDDAAASQKLHDFTAHLRAQTGKAVPVATAERWEEAVQAILESMEATPSG